VRRSGHEARRGQKPDAEYAKEKQREREEELSELVIADHELPSLWATCFGPTLRTGHEPAACA